MMIPRIISSSSVVAIITLLLSSSINAQHHHNRHIKKQNNRQRLLQSTTTTESLCACSPQFYKFQLLLNNDCSSSTLSRSSSSISNVNCQIDDKVDGGLMSSGFVRRRYRDLQELEDKEQSHGNNNVDELERSLRAEDNGDRYDILTSQVQSLLPTTSISKQARQSTTTTVPSYISSILFIEFDTSGLLTLINTNDTYLSNQTLINSTIISYPSISQALNTAIPLNEQLNKIPGGAGLFLFGNNDDGDVVLRSRLVWEFSGDCEIELDIVGDTLGWIMFVSINLCAVLFIECMFRRRMLCEYVYTVGLTYTFASSILYHIFDDINRRRSHQPSMNSVQHLHRMHQLPLQLLHLHRQRHPYQTLPQQVHPLLSQVQVL